MQSRLKKTTIYITRLGVKSPVGSQVITSSGLRRISQFTRHLGLRARHTAGIAGLNISQTRSKIGIPAAKSTGMHIHPSQHRDDAELIVEHEPITIERTPQVGIGE